MIARPHLRGRRLHRIRDVDPTRRGLVLGWIGFTATFALLRLLTWLIRIDVGGLGNVEIAGAHIHHYVWGIVVLALVGAFGLVNRSARWHTWMGLGYGIGLALVVDETALLIRLEDVYWDRQGMVSVAAALMVIGVAGTLLALTRPDDEGETGAEGENEPGATT